MLAGRPAARDVIGCNKLSPRTIAIKIICKGLWDDDKIKPLKFMSILLYWNIRLMVAFRGMGIGKSCFGYG
jgi:hypothetical protein